MILPNLLTLDLKVAGGLTFPLPIFCVAKIPPETSFFGHKLPVPDEAFLRQHPNSFGGQKARFVGPSSSSTNSRGTKISETEGCETFSYPENRTGNRYRTVGQVDSTVPHRSHSILTYTRWMHVPLLLLRWYASPLSTLEEETCLPWFPWIRFRFLVPRSLERDGRMERTFACSCQSRSRLSTFRSDSKTKLSPNPFDPLESIFFFPRRESR